MADISLNGFGGWSGQAGGVVRAYVPGGVLDSEQLILFVASQSDQSHVTPDGWNLLGTARNGFSASKPNVSVFGKVATGEPDYYDITVNSSSILASAGIAHFSRTSDAEQGSGAPMGIEGLEVTGMASNVSVTPSNLVRSAGVRVDRRPGMLVFVAAFIADDYPESFSTDNPSLINISVSNYYNLALAIYTLPNDQDRDYTGVYELQATRAADYASVLFKLSGPPEEQADNQALIWMGH